MSKELPFNEIERKTTIAEPLTLEESSQIDRRIAHAALLTRMADDCKASIDHNTRIAVELVLEGDKTPERGAFCGSVFEALAKTYALWRGRHRRGLLRDFIDTAARAVRAGAPIEQVIASFLAQTSRFDLELSGMLTRPDPTDPFHSVTEPQVLRAKQRAAALLRQAILAPSISMRRNKELELGNLLGVADTASKDSYARGVKKSRRK